jgi:hypothetical protein
MGFLKRWVGKKEKHQIGNRTVIIIDYVETHEDDVEEIDKRTIHEIKSNILKLCKINKMAQEFKELIIKIKEGNKLYDYRLGKNAGAAAHVFIKNKFIITLNVKDLIDKKILYACLTHEITHLWHEYSSKIFSKYHKHYKKISNRNSNRIKLTVISKRSTFIAQLRILFFELFRAFLFEGLAKYCEKFYTKEIKLDDKSYFKKIYGHADSQVGLFSLEWKVFIEVLENNRYDKERLNGLLLSFQTLYRSSYIIGYHMVYTIIYTDKNISIEDIAKMNYIKFINTYERCIKLNRFKPVVSLRSGKGIINYFTLIKETKQIAHKLKLFKS